MNRIRNTIIGAVAAAAPFALAAPAGAAAPSPQVTAFWQELNTLQNASGPCEVLTESTHSTPETEQPVLYSGSCLSAFLLVLDNPTAGLAWVYYTPTPVVTTGAPESTGPLQPPANAVSGTTVTDIECVVVTPAPYSGTFSAGLADASGSCAAYVTEFPPPDTITPTSVTSTTGN